MSTLDELQQVASGLARGMSHDTTLGVAMAAAWLDPLRFSETDYQDDLYGNEEDPETLMRFALSVARGCSPRLYVEMTQGLRSGWSFQQFDDAFCASLKRLYPHIPLHSVYDIIYGIPLEFCGLEQTDPEFPSQFPRLATVLDRFFGVRPTPRCERWQTEDHEEISEQDLVDACQVARPIIRSLIAEDRQPYADLALLLMYLFSITIPLLSPVILFNLVIQMISSFQVFTQAYIIGGGSGGVLNSTLFYTLYLYIQGWTYHEMGYASAMAWVLLLIIGVLTVIVFRSSSWWVSYGIGE